MTAIEIEHLPENQLVDLANQLNSAKRHADLEIVLRRLLAISAAPTHYACPLGWTLMKLRRFADADAAFAEVSGVPGPAQGEGLAGRGMSLVEQGRLEEGLLLLKESIGCGYKDSKVQVALSQTLNRLGRPEDALVYTEELVRLAPADGNFLFLHGNQLVKLERLAEAAEMMKRLVAGKEGRARFGAQAAHILVAAGAFGDALQLIHQLLQAKIDEPGLQTLWTHCLNETCPDKGEATLRAALSKTPSDAVVLLHLSMLLEKRGALDEADAMIARALKAKPESLLVQSQAGRMSMLRQRYEQAAKVYDGIWKAVAGQVALQHAAAPPPQGQSRRAVPPNPIIYMAVEIGSRELQTRLIMARLAVAAGFTVVILGHDTFKASLGGLPPGLIVYKSISSLERDSIAHAAELGHFFTVIDEEAFGRSGDSAVILKNFDLANLVGCANVFAPGEEYRRGVLAAAPGAASQLTVTGNPRTDLYDPRFRDLFRPEAEAIRKELGPTLLVCTNFGGWNSAVNPYASVCLLALKLAGVAMDSPRGKWLLEICRDSNQAECRNTRAIRDAVAALSSAYPSHKIVLRPHPIEDQSVWSRFAAGFDNVVVGGAGTLAAHMMAADATVHLPGCGTGLEAHLMGRPTLCLNVVDDLKYPKLGLSSRLSPMFKNTDELVAATAEAIANPGAYSRLSAEQETLLQYRVLRSEELVCQRIVDRLKQLYEAGVEHAGPNRVSPTNRDLLAALDQALVEGHARAHMKSYANIHAARIKRLDVTAEDLRANLTTLGACIGMSAEFEVTSPVDVAFRISPLRN